MTTTPPPDSPRHRDALVEQFGEGSFPASDPPSTWWGGDGDSPRSGA